jgi:hypothetical protein
MREGAVYLPKGSDPIFAGVSDQSFSGMVQILDRDRNTNGYHGTWISISEGLGSHVD